MSPIRGAVATARRRTTSGGAATFLSETSFGRPPFTPTRTVNFTTSAQLTSALTGLQAGDLIKYTGVGVLTISTSTATAALKIQNKNPASATVIDLGGGAHDYWGAGSTTDYVALRSTYTSQSSCFVVSNCSNLRIYGGDIACDKGYGVEVDGPCTNVTMWDQYVHNVGSSGLWVRDYVGADTYVRNCDFRMEVNRFCMNPAIDSHADKGSGHHGFILHGNTGETSGNRFICYAHDPLVPGEVSFATTWPEGSGGSAVEVGHDGSGLYNNNSYYILGANLLMQPDGTNPGSTGTQFGGCVAALYGNGVLDNNTFGWIEGNNCTGAVMHCTLTGNFDNTTTLTVSHGRHSNVNQYTGVSGMSGENGVTYNLNHGIVYNDCT